ncbi:hypothetical protein QO010_002167 [Caulobacter ginsengisoli]|uniref:Peptidase M4 n=1 Tax=Caulobacter ginsengisoli TaxID=400775 RepID=A0ABU0ISP7_9CAUL|nr:hypothetical protein [Caulobacter ginsengisoli]MDQ0464386.1 hypothetical protein [Caulobacter ginsengisoli]
MSHSNLPLRLPATRRLRVYAFDPQASLDLGSTRFGHATIALTWNDPADGLLEPGPVNDYLEVVDIDPCSDKFYPPIDLNAVEVLGQDGLPPSEGDPRFHQQMVFAVTMKTIKLFERALGRKVIWAQSWNNEKKTYQPTHKLRIYPHALREANAYYSRGKRALLFGYFQALQRSAGASWIFTALSHDIIVHETTHAILDGIHPRYSEPTSLDSLAFHEAFADIAALFSHFQLYEAVYDYIDRQSGQLDQSGLLSGLASQFAKGATGRASLRDFIDKSPNPDLLEGTTEPHDRGAILVAAVFDAFLSIYRARTSDLLRLSGIRPGEGRSLHPDLTARLTKEATKSADHVLRMCIRALDYMPPMDVRFGEFLRGIITADTDLIPDDRLNYRLAFIEAFRNRGIFPDHCLSLSPDNLLWDEPLVTDPDDPGFLNTADILNEDLNLLPEYRRGDITVTAENNRRKVWYWLVQPDLRINDDRDSPENRRLKQFLAQARAAFSTDSAEADLEKPHAAEAFIEREAATLRGWGLSAQNLTALREGLARADSHFGRWQVFMAAMSAQGMHIKRRVEADRAWEDALGLFFNIPDGDRLHTLSRDDTSLHVEVHSVRTTRRAGPDGQDIRQLVIEVTQRRRGYLDPDVQAAQDRGEGGWSEGDFTFRGGATLIIDLRDGRLRYVISKRIDDQARLDQQRRFLLDPHDLAFTYNQGRMGEPFALLHRH